MATHWQPGIFFVTLHPQSIYAHLIMAKKTIIDLKIGESCILSNDRNANPKLGAKLLSDGRCSLFLDFYFGFTVVYDDKQDKMIPKKQKRREMLNIYIMQKPKTPVERQEYKDGVELASRMRNCRRNSPR